MNFTEATSPGDCDSCCWEGVLMLIIGAREGRAV